MSERRHLRPCILSFDLSRVSGLVEILTKDSKTTDGRLPRIRWTSKRLCLRPPLPLSLVTRISFPTVEDKQAFLIAAEDVENVDATPFVICVDEGLFNTEKQAKEEVCWPPDLTNRFSGAASLKKNVDGLQPSLLPTQKPEVEGYSPVDIPAGLSSQSFGGLLAMLYHCANGSDVGARVFNLIAAKRQYESLDKVADPALAEFPVLSQLPVWLDKGHQSSWSDPRVRLFWGAVDAVDEAAQRRMQTTPKKPCCAT